MGGDKENNFIVRLIMLYVLFEYVRPQSFIPGLAGFRIPLILTVLLFLFFLFKGDKSILKHPLIKINIMFIILIAIGLLFAVNHFSVFEKFKFITSYLIAFGLPYIVWVNKFETIRKFFLFWLLVHLFIAIFSLVSSGQGVGSFIQDENDLALVLIMSMPYAYYMANIPGVNKITKVSLYSLLGVLILAVTVSFSRGGFIGMASVLFVIIYSSKEKFKIMSLMFLLFIAIMPLIPESYYEEVRSISDPSESTAFDRFYMWRRGIEMFVDHPVLGVGAGNYNWNVDIYESVANEYGSRTMNHGGRVSHSLYFTIIPEFGMAGIIIFTIIFYKIITRTGYLWSIAKENPDLDKNFLGLAYIAKAIQVSLIGYMTAGAFISVLYYPHLWYLIAIFIGTELTVWRYHKNILKIENINYYKKLSNENIR